MIEVQSPGLLTMVMDLGRPGYQRYGVSEGGALDRLAVRVANAAVGNDDRAALFEIVQVGPDLRFEHPATVAWFGADFGANINGVPLPLERPVRISAGECLRGGRAKRGLRAWLAVAGGIDVPVVLGSRSTDVAAGIGGVDGRALRAGDRLSIGEATRPIRGLTGTDRQFAPWSAPLERLVRPPAGSAVRALCGPEWEWFSADSQQAFFSAEWRVTHEADRMGMRLSGPTIEPLARSEMVSEGVPCGTVQVPAGGRPIVLLAGRQTVGGYPRIAIVAAVDRRLLAQRGPGDVVRFERVSLAEAHAAEAACDDELHQALAGLASPAAPRAVVCRQTLDP